MHRAISSSSSSSTWAAVCSVRAAPPPPHHSTTSTPRTRPMSPYRAGYGSSLHRQAAGSAYEVGRRVWGVGFRGSVLMR